MFRRGTWDTMVTLTIGCAGWSYSDWLGPFYPRGTPSGKFLAQYARVFDFTEVNSSFYNIPRPQMVQAWDAATPANFQFAVKVWKGITHQKKVDAVGERVVEFFAALMPLEAKIACYLFQFPPWFHATAAHIEYVETILAAVPREARCVLELRHNSWFADPALARVVDGTRTVLGTTYLDGVDPTYWPDQQVYYIRLVGNRDLSTFDRVQRTQGAMSAHLTENVDALRTKRDLTQIFIVYNNHFQGFAPRDANALKVQLGLPHTPFSAITHQRTLVDFVRRDAPPEP